MVLESMISLDDRFI